MSELVRPRRGPGRMADPGAELEVWSGRKAQQWVTLTLDTYGRVCWLCGLPGANSADHVVPRSKGGAVFDLANLAPVHSAKSGKACNESRGNRPASDFELVEDGSAFFERG